MERKERTAFRRAVIYARVSTEEQAERGYSLESQIEACLARALKEGYAKEEILVLQDDASGATLNRPGLNALRELAAAPERPERIIVYDPDRLARKLTYQLLLTDEFIKRGIELEFVNFEWKNTPEGRMFYQLRGMFAEFEREKIRERTMRGRLTKLKHYGKLSWDPRLYGYRFDAVNDVLVVEPEESEIVKLIFRLSAEGHSGEQIARMLAEAGVPAPRGSVWYGSTVTRMLNNRAYLGTYMAYKVDYHQGFRRKRAESEQVPLSIEPLVSPELFERAQRTLSMFRTRTGRPSVKPYLLSGIGLCGRCGRPVSAGSVSGKTRRAYYVCAGKRKSGYLHVERGTFRRCESPYWNADVTDEAVWNAVCGYIDRSADLLGQWLRSRRFREMSAGHMLQWKWANARKQSIRKQLERLLDLYLKEKLDRAAYEAKKEALERELRVLEERTDALAAARTEERNLEDDCDPALWREALRKALRKAPADLRQRLVRLLVEEVRFGEDRTLTIRWAKARLSEKSGDSQSDGRL